MNTRVRLRRCLPPVINEVVQKAQPTPLPALWNLKRNLVIDAGRLAVAALLIVRAIGSAIGTAQTPFE